MGPEPARYSLAQLVYTVVLKTLTKEALSSVTSPTPLIKYFISNLQLETKNKTKQWMKKNSSDRSHRFTVNASKMTSL